MNKKRIIISSFVTVLAVGTIGASFVSANVDKRHERVQDAIRNNDFKAFAQAKESCPIAQRIDNKKDFEAIKLAHDLRAEGKYKEARNVLEYAGIEHPGRKVMKHKRDVDVRNAIEKGNWEEFTIAARKKAIATKIDTEEKFNLMVEAHELRVEGRYEEAHEIMQDLGMHNRGRSYMK